MSETTKKFSFDFFAEAPMKDAEGPFKWEKNEAPLQVRQPICKLQLKPKISVDAIINAKNSDYARFSLVDNRNSLFSSNAATDSTACTSRIDEIGSRIDSGVSILSGSIAFNDHMDNSLNQSGFDLRPTVGLGNKFSRRATVNVYGGTIVEDSRESCLDDTSHRVSELEGTVNATNDEVTNIKSASKTGSVSSYRNTSPLRECLNSNRSNGSG